MDRAQIISIVTGALAANGHPVTSMNAPMGALEGPALLRVACAIERGTGVDLTAVEIAACGSARAILFAIEHSISITLPLAA